MIHPRLVTSDGQAGLEPREEGKAAPMVDYGVSARRRWPKAEVLGSGRWAVLSCGQGTEVSLRASKEAALQLKALLDREGCSRRCRGAHEIIDIGETN